MAAKPLTVLKENAQGHYVKTGEMLRFAVIGPKGMRGVKFMPRSGSKEPTHYMFTYQPGSAPKPFTSEFALRLPSSATVTMRAGSNMKYLGRSTAVVEGGQKVRYHLFRPEYYKRLIRATAEITDGEKTQIKTIPLGEWSHGEFHCE